jgi:hypothetical protein
LEVGLWIISQLAWEAVAARNPAPSNFSIFAKYIQYLHFKAFLEGMKTG